MILTFTVLHGETGGKSLHVLWIGLFRRMQFTSFLFAFGAGDILDSRQRKQISHFRGIEEEGSLECHLISSQLIAHQQALDAVAIGFCFEGPMVEQDGQQPVAHIRGKHFLKNRQSHTRFMAQT